MAALGILARLVSMAGFSSTGLTSLWLAGLGKTFFQRPALFVLPPQTASVAEIDEAFVLDNHPISHWRPRNQFWSAIPSRSPRSPFLAVATVVTDLDSSFGTLTDTYESLRASSYQNWRWFVVGASDDSRSLLRRGPRAFANGDPRVSIVHDPSLRSVPAGRNAALVLFVTSGASVAGFLHAGDILELTALEKAAWSLATVHEWSLVGFFEAFFGFERTIVHEGLHSGAQNLNQVRSLPTNSGISLSL